PPRSTPAPYTTLFRSHPAQLQLVSDALLVRRLQEPRAEVTMHLDARADDPVGVLSEAFSDFHAGAIGASDCSLPHVTPHPLHPRSEEHTSELQSRENL